MGYKSTMYLYLYRIKPFIWYPLSRRKCAAPIGLKPDHKPDERAELYRVGIQIYESNMSRYFNY